MPTQKLTFQEEENFKQLLGHILNYWRAEYDTHGKDSDFMKWTREKQGTKLSKGINSRIFSKLKNEKSTADAELIIRLFSPQIQKPILLDLNDGKISRLNSLELFTSKSLVEKFRAYLGGKGRKTSIHKSTLNLLVYAITDYKSWDLFLNREDNVKETTPASSIISKKFNDYTENTLQNCDRFINVRGRSDQISLGKDLYVTRNVESLIWNMLTEQNEYSPKIHIITGEAGYGKTTLLWSLASRLRNEPGIQCVFLKAQQLASFSYDELELLQHEANKYSKRLIFLCDNFDVLINQTTLDDTIVRFKQLQSGGTYVVTTSRPQEASHLLQKIEYGTYRGTTLLPYQDENEELKNAINRYAMAFFAGTQYSPKEVEESIMDAVNRGMPLRVICQIPLTLRMIFELYAPKPIFIEINIQQLYNMYWIEKVEADIGPNRDSKTESLTKEACYLGAILLATGKIEIEEELVRFEFEEQGLNQESLKKLISRGIIEVCGDPDGRKNLRFFHQTFFEYASARSLLLYGPPNGRGIQLFYDHFIKNENDVFLAPILEQLLLQAGDRIGAMESGDRILIQLIKNADSYNIAWSCTWAFVLRERFSEELHNTIFEEFCRFINKCKDHEIIKRFLSLVPLMPASRLPEAEKLWREIWFRNFIIEQCNLLENLYNWTRIETLQVPITDFLLEDHVHQSVTEWIETHVGGGYYAKLIAFLASKDSSRAWPYIQRLLPLLMKRDLLIQFLTEVGQSLDFSVCPDAVSFVESLIVDPKNLKRRILKPDIRIAVGNWWARFWKSTNIPISEILNLVKNSSDSQLKVRMTGFALYTIGAEPIVAQLWIKQLSKEKRTDFRIGFHIYFLPAWFYSKSDEQLTEFDKELLSDFSEVLGKVERKRSLSGTDITKIKMLEAFLKEVQSRNTIHFQVSKYLFENLDIEYYQWVDESSLQSVWHHAWLVFAPGTQTAFRSALHSTSGDLSIIRKWIPRMIALIFDSSRGDIVKIFTSDFLIFCIHHRFADLINKLFSYLREQKNNPIVHVFKELISKQSKALHALAMLMESSEKNNDREESLRLTYFLLKNGFLQDIIFNNYIDFLKQKRNQSRKILVKFLPVLSEEIVLTSASGEELLSTILILRELLSSADEEFQLLLRKTIICLCMEPDDIFKNENESIFSLILNPKYDGSLENELVGFLKKVSRLFPERMYDLLIKILQNESVLSTSSRSKSNLEKKITGFLTRQFDQMDKERNVSFLWLLPVLGDRLGRAVVNAFYSSRVFHGDYEKIWEDVLRHPDMASEIKALVHKNNFHKLRIHGGSAWRKLLNDIKLRPGDL